MNRIINILYTSCGLSGCVTNLEKIKEEFPEGQLIFENNTTKSIENLMSLNFSIQYKKYNLSLKLSTWGKSDWEPKTYSSLKRKALFPETHGIIYIVDSQTYRYKECQKDWELLQKEIEKDIPIIIQYNKRDMQNILSVESLNNIFNPLYRYKTIESVAIEGKGVLETLYSLIDIRAFKSFS